MAEIGFEQFVLGAMAQAAYGLLLDLAHTFACQSIFRTYLFKRHLRLVDAEECLDDVALPVVEGKRG